MIEARAVIPHFISGPLHGVRVPQALWDRDVILARGFGYDVLYVRTLFYRPPEHGGSFPFFCVRGESTDSTTAQVVYLLQRGLLC